ncbi:bifunctional ADP-dependent NAD(P)H-hydrate dehydratase/NAD(P)H-hydrate epimerase [Thermaerobacter sp. FW80]|uniref:bifunctional ADP-dependent NAD(P)H-hydrate dehydratase/NAD(P)H-hydrate epimerase n=1 Tax=Thermaerobacter sp. FW80 TaxID=2546351 RepID=UPI001FAA89EC|nr:bifunctional ADP-dependent NAD(P)H-hydrate dehydratase/NAD(P)H-hydrate epimerase [Thermaerobacter sp. FW80]
MLSAAAVRRGDRLAADAGLGGPVLMETAGRTAATLLWKVAGPFSAREPVVVLAGGGNNGGDGMVLARWVARWAGPTAVKVFLLAEPGRLRGEAAVQWSLLARSGVPAFALAGEPAPGAQQGSRQNPGTGAGAAPVAAEFPEPGAARQPAAGSAGAAGPHTEVGPQPAADRPAAAGPPAAAGAGSGVGLAVDPFLDHLEAAVARARVVVDALLGVGVRGAPRPLAARALQVVGAAGVPVFALDLPSGLDADTGEAAPVVPRATWTATFAAAKWGLVLGQGPERAGQVFVVDIGWPQETGTGVGGTGGEAEAGAPGGGTGGFPSARVLDAAGVAALLPRRPWDAHKGWAGHVVVAGGRPGQVGAAVLAGTAALQAGAGTVTLAVPAPVRTEAAVHRPEIMTWALPATAGGEWDAAAVTALAQRERERRGRVVRVIGPGLGQSPGAAACLVAWLGLDRPAARDPAEGASDDDRPADAPHGRPADGAPGTDGEPGARAPEGAAAAGSAAAGPVCRPTVLDADGLNLAALLGIDRLRERPGSFPLVLTPHPGEAARLLGWTTARVQAERPRAAVELARRAGAVAVLKGAGTLIAGPGGELYICTRGHPGMASAGMGDALAGIVGAFLAQGLEPLAAALVAVFVHALAGELAAPAEGIPVQATQLITRLPEALDRIRRGSPGSAAALGIPGVAWLRPPLEGDGAPVG